MEYFEKRKIAFFHMPKTAGRSVRMFLQDCFGKEILYNKTNNIHEPLTDKIEVMGEITDKYQWTFDNFPDYQKLI